MFEEMPKNYTPENMPNNQKEDIAPRHNFGGESEEVDVTKSTREDFGASSRALFGTFYDETAVEDDGGKNLKEQRAGYLDDLGERLSGVDTPGENFETTQEKGLGVYGEQRQAMQSSEALAVLGERMADLNTESGRFEKVRLKGNEVRDIHRREIVRNQMSKDVFMEVSRELWGPVKDDVSLEEIVGEMKEMQSSGSIERFAFKDFLNTTALEKMDKDQKIAQLEKMIATVAGSISNDATEGVDRVGARADNEALETTNTTRFKIANTNKILYKLQTLHDRMVEKGEDKDAEEGLLEAETDDSDFALNKEERILKNENTAQEIFTNLDYYIENASSKNKEKFALVKRFLLHKNGVLAEAFGLEPKAGREEVLADTIKGAHISKGRLALEVAEWIEHERDLFLVGDEAGETREVCGVEMSKVTFESIASLILNVTS